MTERDALLARIDALERERAEIAAHANEEIAAAQDQTYWLARWHVDIERLEARPGGPQLLGVLRRIAPRR